MVPSSTFLLRQKAENHILPTFSLAPCHHIQPMMLPENIPSWSRPRAFLTRMTSTVSQLLSLLLPPSVFSQHRNESDTYTTCRLDEVIFLFPTSDGSHLRSKQSSCNGLQSSTCLHSPTSLTSLPNTLTLTHSAPATLPSLLLCKHQQTRSGLRVFVLAAPSTLNAAP